MPKLMGVLAVVGGACYHFCIGSMYLWGAMSMYVTSYLYRGCGDESASSQLLMCFLPVRSGLMLFLLPLGAYMEKRWGPEPGVIISFAVWLACFIPLYWVKSTYGYILLMGFGFGIPTGLGYVPPLSVGWKHFPNNKGMVSGIILCAFGSGTAFLTYVVTFVVNPHDHKVSDIKNKKNEKLFDENVYNNVPEMWMVLNIIWGIMLLIAVITLHNPKGWKKPEQAANKYEHDEVMRAYSVDTISFGDLNEQVRNASIAAGRYPKATPTEHTEPTESEHSVEKVESSEEPLLQEDGLSGSSRSSKSSIRSSRYLEHECPSVKIGMKSMNFIIMTIMLTMAIFVDFFFSLAYKPLGQHYGYSDLFLSVVGSLYSFFNGFMRLFWGWMFERSTYRLLIGIILTVMIILCGTLPWMGPLSHATFLIWIDTNVLFISGNYPIYPPTCARLFGGELGAQVYGFMAGMAFTSSAVLCFLANYYLIGEHLVSYNGFLWIAAGINVPSLFMLFILYRSDPKWTPKTPILQTPELALAGTGLTSVKESSMEMSMSGTELSQMAKVSSEAGIKEE